MFLAFYNKHFVIYSFSFYYCPITIFVNQQSDNSHACNPAYNPLVHLNNTNKHCLMLPKSKLLFQHTSIESDNS